MGPHATVRLEAFRGRYGTWLSGFADGRWVQVARQVASNGRLSKKGLRVIDSGRLRCDTVDGDRGKRWLPNSNRISVDAMDQSIVCIEISKNKTGRSRNRYEGSEMAQDEPRWSSNRYDSSIKRRRKLNYRGKIARMFNIFTLGEKGCCGR
jgi:hypothetical protein